MDKAKDPILAEQTSISTQGLEYTFINLPKSVIEIVNANIYLIWTMGNYCKTIKPEDIIFNAQQMFMSEDVKSNDVLWKEHCAASLRELVDSHFEANCPRFLKCIPNRNESDEAKQICETLVEFKIFFNDFAHFKNTAIEHAKTLMGSQNLEEISEGVFDKLCTDFIFHLERYFKYKNR